MCDLCILLSHHSKNNYRPIYYNAIVEYVITELLNTVSHIPFDVPYDYILNIKLLELLLSLERHEYLLWSNASLRNYWVMVAFNVRPDRTKWRYESTGGCIKRFAIWEDYNKLSIQKTTLCLIAIYDISMDTKDLNAMCECFW